VSALAEAIRTVLERYGELPGRELRTHVLALRRSQARRRWLRWTAGVSLARFYVTMYRLELAGVVKGRWNEHLDARRLEHRRGHRERLYRLRRLGEARVVRGLVRWGLRT
jgi:DNA-binding PadR family transcriptional regulator